MSNEDFWKSIKDLVENGFKEDGLKTLDDYARKISYGKILYKRFSPQEQRGLAEGGETHVIASLLAGAGIGADKLSAPEGSFKREQQLRGSQERVIEDWAKKVGLWIDNTDEQFKEIFGAPIAEGGESKVYYDGADVRKTIRLDYYILPELALDRVTLHNYLFPESNISVLGFGRDTDGEFVFVVKQPFIQGEKMTEDQIRAFAEDVGFSLRNPRNWTYTNDSIYLSDLHDENVILTPNGGFCVIDCDVRINTPALKLGGKRTLSNEVEFVQDLPLREDIVSETNSSYMGNEYSEDVEYDVNLVRKR